MNIHEYANKYFCSFELCTKGQCLSCNLESKLLFYDHQNVSYDQLSTPALLYLSAILFFGGHLEHGRIGSGYCSSSGSVSLY